jgi:DMATS type aromatic prenyltransferase
MSTTTIIHTPEPLHNGESTDSAYWWLTSGSDLANMMLEAGYPDEVQRQFLTYYRQTLCPLLGRQPSAKSAKSGLGWDGSPFEYSFELKSSSASESVRFGVDFANLSPPDGDDAGPLDITGIQKVVDSLAGRTVGFDDTWYRSLVKFFDQSNNPKSKQLELVSKAGHQTPIVLGFDLYPRIPSSPETLPVMGKVYFPPCHFAAAKGLNRWDAIYQAVQQLPDVASFPSVLNSLNIIGDYLASKPDNWKDGARYLATDFVAPGEARLKIYLRYPGESFDEIWDYYTLGGRIPALDDDKALFRDLIALTGPGSEHGGTNPDLDYTHFRRKMTCIYFSLSPDNPTPAPKIGIYPANFAANDGVIARGLDTWLRKYNWRVPRKSIEGQMKSVL